MIVALGLTGILREQLPAPCQGPDPVLRSRNPAALPDDAEPEPDDDRADRPRTGLRVGLLTFAGSLHGHIKKQRWLPGSTGSGGESVDLRHDLDMDRLSLLGGLELALNPGFRELRLRAAVEGATVRGETTHSRSFEHKGRTYPAGDPVRSRFSMILADAEFHFLPRQERFLGPGERLSGRYPYEFGLFMGVRAFRFDSTLEGSTAGRVSERLSGAYPRFGLEGRWPIGAGFVIFGSGGIGAWLGQADSRDWMRYEVEVQLGVGCAVMRGRVAVELRAGVRYLKVYASYRDRSDDGESVFIERGGFLFDVALIF